MFHLHSEFSKHKNVELLLSPFALNCESDQAASLDLTEMGNSCLYTLGKMFSEPRLMFACGVLAGFVFFWYLTMQKKKDNEKIFKGTWIELSGYHFSLKEIKSAFS